MQLWPETSEQKRETIRRIGLEITLGVVATYAVVTAQLEPPHHPAYVKVPSTYRDGTTYTLPTARYKDLVSFSDPEQGTVKFVHKRDANAYLDGRRVQIPYDYNFRYNFVVVAQGEHMFDKGSPYMPPDLNRDFDAVKSEFCGRHKDLKENPDHEIHIFCPRVE